jgi:glycosyltransferase involved in cell wall biosynthesis
MKKPRLLCLPADSVSSLPRLGVGSFIWQHYAPEGFFEHVMFAYLDNREQTVLLNETYSICLFKKRWGNTILSKAFFYLIRIPYFAMRLIKLIKREQIDVIRARSASYNALAGVIAAKLTGRPSAISIHAPYAEDRQHANRSKWVLIEEAIVEKLSIRWADRVYGVSTAMRDYAIKMGATPHKAQVLYNRVNIEKFQHQNIETIQALKKRLNISPQDRVLITVGRLVPQKDPITLLQALKYLIQQNPNYRLIIIGIGYLKNQMETFIQNNNLSDNVHFENNVNHDDLPAYFHISHVFVLPALYEGFGIVLIEAQAAGLPIVTTRISGTADVVSDQNAILTPVGDPLKFAAGIAQIFNDPSGTHQRTLQGLKDVQRFTEQAIQSREIQLYENLLNSHQSATT